MKHRPAEYFGNCARRDRAAVGCLVGSHSTVLFKDAGANANAVSTMFRTHPERLLQQRQEHGEGKDHPNHVRLKVNLQLHNRL